MRKILTLITVATLILSCSTKEKQKDLKIDSVSESIKRNHEILNVILNRWDTLSNTYSILKSGDTLTINKIVLIAKPKTDIDIDTTNNDFAIKTHTLLLSVHDKIVAHRDTVLRQLKQKTTNWNSGLIFSSIWIIPSLTEKNVSFPGELHDKNTFLVVSEPIEFNNDEFFVIGLLYTKKVLLDNLYIIKRKENKWKVVDVQSAIIRLVVSPTKIIKQKDGSTIKERTKAAIFEGYIE